MAEQKPCRFQVLRYMPDLIKGESVNIGLIFLNEANGTAEVRFTRDWRRVRCLDPEADLEMLQAVETELRERLREEGNGEQFLQWLEGSFANALQLSAPQGLLTEAPERELARLAEMYLEKTRYPAQRTAAGRGAIVAKMRDSFRSAGVWDLMFKQFAVARYTHPGDPLKLDCGYRPNGVMHLFHAVSLNREMDAAKALAFSYPQVREGVLRLEGARTELTAILEPDLRRDDPEILFALDTLRQSSIQTATTDDLPRLAETARRELRA